MADQNNGLDKFCTPNLRQLFYSTKFSALMLNLKTKRMRVEIENLSRDEFSQMLSDALEKASKSNPVSDYRSSGLLSREETAKMLKINLSTLNEWTKKGYLKVYAKGYRRYYKEDEVLDSLISLNKTNDED